MATNRQYESANIFGARIVDMRHLWEPSREYQGQPTQKPNYFAAFLVPKTQAHWSQEPIFAGIMQAFGNLWNGSLKAFHQHPHGMNAVQWPIRDGDLPNDQGKMMEAAKGHWLFGASTGSPVNVEMVQTGGVLAKLAGKIGVKSGDFCMVGVTAAVKTNQANGVKFYLNAVVFTAPGEEIVFANSVSGAELMRMAQAQGFQVTGFSPSPGGFSGGGFPGGGHHAAPGHFQPPQGPFTGAPGGGFTHGSPGGFAPTPAAPAFTPHAGHPAPQGPAPAPFGGPGPGNGSAFPSNSGALGFTPPSHAFSGGPATAPQPAQNGYAPGPGAPATAFPSNPQWPQR